jgi:hypothetical protein
MEQKALIMAGYLNEHDIPNIRQFITGIETSEEELKGIVTEKNSNMVFSRTDIAGKPEFIDIDKTYTNILDSLAVKIKESKFFGNIEWYFKNVEIGPLLSGAVYLNLNKVNQFTGQFSAGDFSNILQICLDTKPSKIPVMIEGNSAIYQCENNEILNLQYGFNNILQVFHRSNISPVKIVRSNDKYRLVDGHHRAIALKKAGVKHIPAVVLNDNPGLEYGVRYHYSEPALLRDNPPLMEYFCKEEYTAELPLRKKHVTIYKVQWDVTNITI